MAEKWVRTCQECGNKQEAKKPPQDKELSDAYCNAKCRKCKSEALDYGRTINDVSDDEEV